MSIIITLIHTKTVNILLGVTKVWFNSNINSFCFLKTLVLDNDDHIITKLPEYHRRDTIGDYSICMERKDSKFDFDGQSCSPSNFSLNEKVFDSPQNQRDEFKIDQDEINCARYAKTIAECELVSDLVLWFVVLSQ